MRISTLATAAILLAAVPPAASQDVINGVYTVDDTNNTGPQQFGLLEVGAGADGTLHVLDGRLVRASGDTLVARAANFSFSPTGTVNVVGNDSRLEVAGTIRVGFNPSIPTRTAFGFLNVTAGARVRAEALELAGFAHPAQGTVTVSGHGSLLEIVTVLQLIQGASRSSTLTIGPGATLSVGTAVQINGSPAFVLDGGTLSLPDVAAAPPAASLQVNSGSFRFRSSQTLDGSPGFYTDSFGSPPVLAAGRGLVVDGTTTLGTSLELDGGSLRTGRIAIVPGSGSLALHGGVLTLTGERVVIDDGSDFGLDPLVVGDGAGDAALLELAGAGDVMLGTVTLAPDGALSFGGETLIADTLTNDGRITIADARLELRSGLLNTGSLHLDGAVVGGAVSSPAGSTIDVGGTAVFEGAFAGAPSFHGSGTVVFNGSLSVD